MSLHRYAGGWTAGPARSPRLSRLTSRPGRALSVMVGKETKDEPEEADTEPEVGSVPSPPFLAWTHLTMKETAAFIELQTPSDCLKFVSTKFGLQDYEMNARNAITLDLYLETLSFSKDVGFNAEKTSTFFTIMKMTHEFALKSSLTETFDFFRKLVLKHSLSGIDDCTSLFDAQDVKCLTEHVSTSYMQHFRLFQYAFSKEQEKDQYTAHLFVNTAFPVQPLSTFINQNEPQRPASRVILRCSPRRAKSPLLRSLIRTTERRRSDRGTPADGGR